MLKHLLTHMNWKKILLYALATVLFLTVASYLFTERELGRIYGGFTEKVAKADLIAPQQPVLIKHVQVLSADGERFIPRQSLYLADGLIVAMDSFIEVSPQTWVINGRGKFLIPGLIDAHVHLLRSPNDLLLYLANGITGIKEMDGTAEHLAWRKEIQAGKRPGPDMYVASARIGSFGTVEGWFMAWTQGMENVRDRGEAQALVDEVAAAGYDGIKIYSQLNQAGYEALNELAPEAGLDVIGHIPIVLNLADFFASNQQEVAHLEEFMKLALRDFGSIGTQAKADSFLQVIDEISRDIAPKLLEKEVAVTTTLWLMESFLDQKFALDSLLSEIALAYANPGLTEWNQIFPGLGWLPQVNRYRIRDMESRPPGQLERIRRFWITYAKACEIILQNLHAQGVTILAGTDANVPVTVPGFSLHDELESLHAAGLSAASVLRAATSGPGRWMGHQSGSIQEGMAANLLLLDADPLEDIRHTRDIHTVITHGRVYDRAMLDKILEAVKQANDHSRNEEIGQYAGN